MSPTPVRRVLDRLAARSLSGALSARPVAAMVGLARDPTVGLRVGAPADDVLGPALARVEAGGEGEGDASRSGDPAVRRRPASNGAGGGRPSPAGAPGPPAAVPGAGGSTRGLAARPSFGGSAAGHRPPAGRSPAPPAPADGVATGRTAPRPRPRSGPSETSLDAAGPVVGEVPATSSPPALPAVGSGATSAARHQVVAPAAMLHRQALDGLARPSARAATVAPVPPLDRRPAVSPAPAAATGRAGVAPTEGPTVAPIDVARRPRGLADLAALFTPTAPAAPWAPAGSELAGGPPTDAAARSWELATRPGSRPAPAAWNDAGAGPRTVPSPAGDLAGAAAVVEAVLVHEARRYGVAVEES